MTTARLGILDIGDPLMGPAAAGALTLGHDGCMIATPDTRTLIAAATVEAAALSTRGHGAVAPMPHRAEVEAHLAALGDA